MVKRSNAKNTKNLWALTRPYDRCLVLLDWVAIVAVFQSSRAICHRDTVGNALSRTKRRPTLVSPSRSYSTTLKYLPCSVEVYVYLPTWTRRFQMKTFPCVANLHNKNFNKHFTYAGWGKYKRQALNFDLLRVMHKKCICQWTL